MEIKIGISEVSREITVKADTDADTVTEALRAALADNGLFELTDAQGRRVVVPAKKVGYLDFGASGSRPVGFGTV